MEFIPMEQSKIMELDQNNTKAVRSPPIREKFSIHSDGIYNYALNELKNNNIDKPYNFIVELKKLLRCVWQTKFTKAETPNISLLKQSSMFQKMITPFYGNKILFVYPNKKNKNSYEPNKLDDEALITIERNLIPSFEYNFSTYSDRQWDQFLLIYDNILLSEIIQRRKEQLNIREKDIAELNNMKNEISKQSYDEQLKDIMDNYTATINNIKNDYIFKAINYLNYLYYNNINRDLVWSVVLLRLSSLTHIKYHDETFTHHEKDLAEYIRSCKKETEFELLQFYVSIIVYLYQFKHHSITIYDKDYLEIMLKYLTGHLPTYNEYISQLYKHINDNLIILRYLVPTKELLNYVKTNELNKFSYKTKALSAELHKYYTDDELNYYNISDRISYLIDSSEINKLFNKITSKNYKEICSKLETYDIKHVLACFIDNFISVYSAYSFYSLHYMIEHFGKLKMKNAIIKSFDDNFVISSIGDNSKIANSKGNNNSVASSKRDSSNITNKEDGKIIGLMIAVFDNDIFYKYSANRIDTLTEIIKNEPTTKILNFALSEANNLLTEVKGGYEKFTLEEVINNINNMLPEQQPKKTAEIKQQKQTSKMLATELQTANKTTTTTNKFASLCDDSD